MMKMTTVRKKVGSDNRKLALKAATELVRITWTAARAKQSNQAILRSSTAVVTVNTPAPAPRFQRGFARKPRRRLRSARLREAVSRNAEFENGHFTAFIDLAGMGEHFFEVAHPELGIQATLSCRLYPRCRRINDVTHRGFRIRRNTADVNFAKHIRVFAGFVLRPE